MKQAHKKRPPHATANSPPGLPDMGKLLYKSGKFIKCMFEESSLGHSSDSGVKS